MYTFTNHSQTCLYIITGELKTFVLEKSRVVQHKAKEKNFHIFYAFFSGIPEDELQEKYNLNSERYRYML